jgi:hypothetical protein
VRRVHRIVRLGRASRSCPSGQQASTVNPPSPTLPTTCTDEADATGNHARMLAVVSLPRAGGRPLELPDQSGQAGLHVSRSSGRACRLHACTLVCICTYGTSTCPKTTLSRAVSVRHVTDDFGPRVFACAESRLCLWLGVSGMAADCSCSAW